MEITVPWAMCAFVRKDSLPWRPGMFSSSSRRLLAAMQVEMRYIKSRSVATTFAILRERRGRGKTSRKDSSMNEVGLKSIQTLGTE